MEVIVTYEIQDWEAYQAYLENEIPKSVKTPMDSFWLNVIVWAGIGALSMVAFRFMGDFHWPSGSLIFVLCSVIFVLFLRSLNNIKGAFAPSSEGSFLGTHKLSFSDRGIEAAGDGYSSFHEWFTVKKIVRADGMIMLFIDTAYAFILPEAQLHDPDGFYTYVTALNK